MDRRSALEVVRPGPLALVQDAGRPGFASMGVSPSGAADRGSYALANRLVGNPVGAAALELVLGGLVVRARGSVLVALTGAPAPGAVNGRVVDHGVRVYLRDGDVLELGTPASGLRTYLAVAGGIDVPAVLGSRSTDVLAGLGPPPIAAGDLLPIGEPGGLVGLDAVSAASFGESPAWTSRSVPTRVRLSRLARTRVLASCWGRTRALPLGSAWAAGPRRFGAWPPFRPHDPQADEHRARWVGGRTAGRPRRRWADGRRVRLGPRTRRCCCRSSRGRVLTGSPTSAS